MKPLSSAFFFVDCEAYGACPSMGRLTEFGAVHYRSRTTFHGVLLKTRPSVSNPAVPESVVDDVDQGWAPGWTYERQRNYVFGEFEEWIVTLSGRGRVTMVSDNPAFDFQWINDGFWLSLGRNPFGHSARRIGDFYAGLVGDFYETQKWKGFRRTVHDHSPVNDAMGNVEAFETLLQGSR